ncbi:glutathione S-transferase family protein [Bordetella genomosp. 12]|uniref:Glutathione S-transferase n=1 Tax=Bordetella genomosp. 12 TaxID=463035 RepID=A0A261VV00_9BORD|nr:glutathione S-transferase family protein [Bordetella genomosp. 12]OZI77915.1 glutathione S-transferase [Bordetella genomosp. 12]
MRILGKTSSINVRKVLWTCDELGLRPVREDWGAGRRALDEPAFLALNPNAQVPVLVDDDFVLWESNSILRYLANRYAGGWLYPAAPRARARVDQWMDWQATDLNTAWRYAYLGLRRRAPAYQDGAQIQASCLAWSRAMGVLEARLGQTAAYVAGPDFSLADIVIGLSVLRWRVTDFDKPALPAIDAYCLRLAARPGFIAYAEP